MRGAGAVLKPYHLQQQHNRGAAAALAFSAAAGAGAGAGAGRGRGRGGWLPPSHNATIGNPPEQPQTPGVPAAESNFGIDPDPWRPAGRGHGRDPGRNPSNPNSNQFVNPFAAWNTQPQPPQAGRGRGITPSTESEPSQQQTESSRPPGPIFLKLSDKSPRSADSATETEKSEKMPPPAAPGVGYGRGKGLVFDGMTGKVVNSSEENRHLRASSARSRGRQSPTTTARPRASGEEAVKHAMNILSQSAQENASRGEYVDRADSGGRRAFGGRGGRGERGRGRGRGRGGRGERAVVAEADGEETFSILEGNEADHQRLLSRVGAERVKEIEDAIGEVAEGLLPHPDEEFMEDSLDTNFKLEFEPEFAMEDFSQNPDIDEKPPITLREYLEKMKPYVFATDGLETEGDWQEYVDDAMDKAPYLKLLTQYYAGPQRLTATQEQKYLRALTSGLPSNTEKSVKDFMDNTLLTLQSNPGWDYYSKYQFMKKLTARVGRYCGEKQA